MKFNLTLLFFIILWSKGALAQPTLDLNKAFTHAESQSRIMLQEIATTTNTQLKLVSPRTLTSTGKLKLTSAKDWTSGFFPGNLWFLYEHTQDPYWLTQAQDFTAKIEAQQFDTGTHDVGFKVYNSFGTGYRLTQDPNYRQVIIQAAKSLATRYNANTGCIRSWDHSTRKWKYPVIIDNMMNLELLFTATRLTGDSTYYKIAVSHANTTLKNHFRPDNSSWHVVDYDSITGEVIKKTTAQGYSDSSAWARGQAWGLYGYTMCYRETKDSVYLELAEKIAAYILNHPNLPIDGIPYWDYNAPLIPLEPRDASAAAIAASALYELSTYSSLKETWFAAADKTLNNLATKYNSPVGKNRGFILLHSTGNKPGNGEVDVPLIYADYYYLEALTRRKQINTPPQIAPISNKNIKVGKTLSFVVSANDSNSNQILSFSLVNAPSGAQIDSKTGGFTWTPTQTGIFKFLIRVTDNGSPILTTELPITVTVNPVKLYTLQIKIIGNGSVTRDPVQNSYKEDTQVKLKAVPAAGYRFVGWSGDFTGINATPTIIMDKNKRITAKFALIPPQIIKVNLLDADANKVITTLQDGAVLNLSKLPIKNLTIEALVNTATTKSVIFNLSGELSRTQVESVSPYVLFGDIKGNPNAWVPTEGIYTLKVTPYSDFSGEGIAGKTRTINFTVIDDSSIAGLQKSTIFTNAASNVKESTAVYPNPTVTGKVQVRLPSTFKGKINYTLLSLLGVKLAEGAFNLEQSGDLVDLDFSHQMFSTGVYNLKVQSATTEETIKIVRH